MKEKTPYRDGGLCFLTVLVVTAAANCRLPLGDHPHRGAITLALILAGNLLPLLSPGKFPDLRTRLCNHGNLCLRAFRISAPLGLLFHLAVFPPILFFTPGRLLSLAQFLLVETLLYWNGMIFALTSATQLRFHHRTGLLLLGKIPVLLPFMLGRVIRLTAQEIDFEVRKQLLNRTRKSRRICATRYPILLVHGVFFRDSVKSNYWNRIPGELEKNGATVFYGQHQSANTIMGSGREIQHRIREICQSTGCEKVNIIAHSKGGLDCRAAISDPETAAMVASLTTVSTPHRGCQFADFLLSKFPESFQQTVADNYNTAARKKGDYDPDFLGAVRDLTSSVCKDFDGCTPPPAGVFCQSFGSRLDRAIDGVFPLNFCSRLVKYFDGANDGLVGETAFSWGEKYTFLTTDGDRGISHGDTVDQNRENIPGFDVREFYVQLVADLKNRGF